MGDIRNLAADAVEERVYSHTVAIVYDDRPGIGSGVALSWAGKRLILTARHVIEDCHSGH